MEVFLVEQRGENVFLTRTVMENLTSKTKKIAGVGIYSEVLHI